MEMNVQKLVLVFLEMCRLHEILPVHSCESHSLRVRIAYVLHQEAVILWED